jgi:cytochrome c-type biogenesis protein CcmH
MVRRLAGLVSGALLALALAAPAAAIGPGEALPDPKLEARARGLSAELRCLVCQNQSIDDSDAPIAKDLRLIIRERLQAGANEADVKDYLVARYGEFILLKPRFAWHTAVLWAAPFAALLLGAFLAWRGWRGRGAAPRAAGAPLSEAEKKALDALVGEEPRGKG